MKAAGLLLMLLLLSLSLIRRSAAQGTDKRCQDPATLAPIECAPGHEQCRPVNHASQVLNGSGIIAGPLAARFHVRDLSCGNK